MIKNLILLIALILIVGRIAKAENCEKHPIYCQIIQNKPSIDKNYAMKLSNIIYKYTKEYDLDKNIFTAILMQESSFNLKAMNCRKGVIKKDTDKYCHYEPLNFTLICEKTTNRFELVKVCDDFGISQINWRTILRYKFDINSLINDLDYSVKAGAIVLNGFKNIYKNEKTYWTRYNTSNKRKRKIYKQLVGRYFYE